MEINFSQEDLDELKKDSYFPTIEQGIAEIREKLKTFAHQEDCTTNEDCPYECCEEQLTPMSAIVWDIAEVMDELTYIFRRINDDDRGLEDAYEYLIRSREMITVVNDILWFSYRASNHPHREHSSDYWFWTDLVNLRTDFNNLRYGFIDRLCESGLGFD